MSSVPVRDLRNRTAEILRRVEAGERIDVMRGNYPVARIVPPKRRRTWVPAVEIMREPARSSPYDSELAAELRETLTDTTDDLPW